VGFTSRNRPSGRIRRFEESSDRVLASRSGAGDEGALAALYERYVCDLSDFVHSVVRDWEIAADAVPRTFVRVWDGLRLGVRVDFVRAWLFSTARDEALESLRQGHAGSRAVGRSTVIEATRAAGDGHDQDLVQLVHASAARLSSSDYSLLDLHLRRDLSASELGLALGLDRIGIGLRLSQLEARLAAPVTAGLLARYGRGGCGGLDAELRDAKEADLGGAEWAARRHLRGCAVCREWLRNFAAPAEVFAGLAAVPPSEHFRATSWERVSGHLAASGREGAVATPRRTMGFPRQRHGRASPGRALGAAATTLGVVIAAAALAAHERGRGDGDGAQAVAKAPTQVTSVPSPGAFLPPDPTAASPSSLQPADGSKATPGTVRTFAWAAARGAVGYEFVLLKEDDPIFSARTSDTTLELPSTWRYRGKPQRVVPGMYRWIVWPIVGSSGERAGIATVAATLIVD
jgi:DNA-directed RNA polymerase specialized sigma24 family protein